MTPSPTPFDPPSPPSVPRPMPPTIDHRSGGGPTPMGYEVGWCNRCRERHIFAWVDDAERYKEGHGFPGHMAPAVRGPSPIQVVLAVFGGA